MRSFLILSLAVLFAACQGSADKQDDGTNSEQQMEHVKKEIGNVVALYPKPIVLVGVMQDDRKPTWMPAGHLGVMCHDHIMVSMKKGHFTNQFVYANKRLSISLVDEAMLPDVDEAGQVSGFEVDKSEWFDFTLGEGQTPIPTVAPVTMELKVEDNYELNGFDNFICVVEHTYADERVLRENGKLDYDKVAPILFDMPSYKYHRLGTEAGNCRQMKR